MQEADPGHYIERVSLATGEVLEGPIEPDELLVRKHRDYHIVDVYARSLMSWLVKTGDEEHARSTMKRVRSFGKKTAEMLAKALGSKDPKKIGEALFGLKRREFYFRYKRQRLKKQEIEARLQRLREESRSQLEQARGLRVLLTGGTGFVGKEVMCQAARDDEVSEMVVLIRPKVIKNRRTGEVERVLTPTDRGRDLLRELWLDDPTLASKFRFIDGDIEKAGLGISPDDLKVLERTLTHVIHCAASVAFDDPYLESYRANVLGSLNALNFSLGLQCAKDSPFVAHLSIETAYIHGRQVRQEAREEDVVFPRNFYNNFYELTKAFGSIETERFMLDEGLRVVQLCPAIVIGDSRTGNNRGDQKVVNAPVNAFGRAKEALRESQGDFLKFGKTWVLYKMASIFPGDPSAQLNLIPVDWVARGIVAALKRPEAVGERIHLATDNRITAQDMQDILRDELRVDVKLTEPTMHRAVQLPMFAKFLETIRQRNLARALRKLGTIFGGYSEWGQPIHAVGHDVKVLGLPEQRPNTEAAFRMLCRHNKYVQQFGRQRDPLELARREKLWSEFIQDLEERTGQPASSLSSNEFRKALKAELDLELFQPRTRESPAGC